ncbi:hypothetical protein FB451DRAFT_1531666 [Mycena latifolia]|nr:hypothetical protein FB451DRAFT_1531666 [Mycena latifolia]
MAHFDATFGFDGRVESQGCKIGRPDPPGPPSPRQDTTASLIEAPVAKPAAGKLIVPEEMKVTHARAAASSLPQRDPRRRVSASHAQIPPQPRPIHEFHRTHLFWRSTFGVQRRIFGSALRRFIMLASTDTRFSLFVPPKNPTCSGSQILSYVLSGVCPCKAARRARANADSPIQDFRFGTREENGGSAPDPGTARRRLPRARNESERLGSEDHGAASSQVSQTFSTLSRPQATPITSLLL